MTQQQENLFYLIAGQRKIVEQFPDDLVEKQAFESLVCELRATFRVISGGKVELNNYVPSRSGRVLKLVRA